MRLLINDLRFGNGRSFDKLGYSQRAIYESYDKRLSWQNPILIKTLKVLFLREIMEQAK
jgi:hypothetical protein